MAYELAAVRIPLGSYSLILADASHPHPVENLTAIRGLPDGWKGEGRRTGPIRFAAGAQSLGMQQLQVFENTSYFWSILPNSEGGGFSGTVESSLQQPGKAKWFSRKIDGRCSGEFSVGNYLGTAWIRVDEVSLRFDVIPRKLDFETEYKSMLESIAKVANTLLLEWNSPTTHPLTSDWSRSSESLLEQFLFVRHFLGAKELDYCLEMIVRRPHTSLASDEEWVPAAVADLSALVPDPIGAGRTWRVNEDKTGFVIGGLSAEDVRQRRKYATTDTMPNRFVRFALEEFRELCDEVARRFAVGRGTAYLEASALRDQLDAALQEPVLRSASKLLQVPTSNIVLQRREGYLQVFKAWWASNVASALHWPGLFDAYDGTNRNVAVLYEYWLFFVLRDLLLGELRFVPVADSDTDFSSPCISSGATGLRVNLRRGAASGEAFRSSAGRGDNLRAHLYYNRSFSFSSDVCDAATSYSRRFIPDYTLAVFTEEHPRMERSMHEAEQEAAKRGRLRFVHFDAKYRVEKPSDVFGAGDSDGLVGPENGSPLYHQSNWSGYVPEDLLKMHTYLDAIRGACGCFVLYPGTGDVKQFQMYHELLPGVGAIAVKPAYRDGAAVALGSDNLARMLETVISLTATYDSDLNTIESSTRHILRC